MHCTFQFGNDQTCFAFSPRPPPLNRFRYFSNRLTVLTMRRLKNENKGKKNFGKHTGAAADLLSTWHQTPAPPDTPQLPKEATCLSPPSPQANKWWLYLHGPTVGFNVNHIASLYSLFLQTFKNTGVQLKIVKQNNENQRRVTHTIFISDILYSTFP